MALINNELIDADKNFADALVKNTEEILTPKVRIKYHHEDMPRLKKIKQGDWIDLYTSGEVTLKAGDFIYIDLGVSMELPAGYEAIQAPRSSTFKNWGLLQANAIGVYDESFHGDTDIWKFPAYATRDVTIPAHTRLCQFRIIKHQPDFIFDEVDTLGNVARGGWGTTGTGKL